MKRICVTVTIEDLDAPDRDLRIADVSATGPVEFATVAGIALLDEVRDIYTARTNSAVEVVNGVETETGEIAKERSERFH